MKFRLTRLVITAVTAISLSAATCASAVAAPVIDEVNTAVSSGNTLSADRSSGGRVDRPAVKKRKTDSRMPGGSKAKDLPLRTVAPTGSSIVSDMPDGPGKARISELELSRRWTGTAPFDKDDGPGDDRDDTNDIVRSFDWVTYEYSFQTEAVKEHTYFRNARIGFRFVLRQPDDRVTFDLSQMNWADQSLGYAPKIQKTGAGDQEVQTLTIYRLLRSTDNVPTVVPGGSKINLVLKVGGAPNGTEFSPEAASWVSTGPNGGDDDMAETGAAPPVTVSAKPNVNIRITPGSNEGSEQRVFDFAAEGAQGYANYGLGKRKGTISKINWAVDMRSPDRSKGLKGLEAPTGDITFSLVISNRWKQATQNSFFGYEKDLQPYFWDIGTIDGGFNNGGRDTRKQDKEGNASVNGSDGWYPNFYNYDYARSDGGRIGQDRVSGNGRYRVSEERFKDRTVLTFTLSGYKVDGSAFPKLGITHANNAICSPVFMSNDCGRQEVAEISTGYLYVFNPTTVKDGKGQEQTVTDHYGDDRISLQSAFNDGGLVVKSASGQLAGAVSGPTDTSNQAAGDDDQWSNSMYVQGDGTGAGISNLIQYSCLNAPNYFDNGVDCGWWTAPDNLHGTDSTMIGTQVRIFAGYDFHTPQAELPLLSLSLVKVDPRYIDIPDSDNLDLPNYGKTPGRQTQWSGNGIWQDGKTPDEFGAHDPLTLIKYVTKADGKSWDSDREQANADIGDSSLRYYDTKAEAEKKGPIVGILLGARTAASSQKADEDARFGFGGFKVNAKDDIANIGSVAQLTSTVHAFSRTQLATAAGLDPVKSSDEKWEQWAEKQDPFALWQSEKPRFSPSVSGYQKARYDNVHGYLGGDSGGHTLGDSLYLTGEKATISKSIEQKGSDGQPKKVFDIDQDQRVADWRLTSSVKGVASLGTAVSDLYVSDVVPANLSYVPGSAVLGGTYDEDRAGNGTVTGGVPLADTKVGKNDQGQTLLSWTVRGVRTDGDSKVVIHYSTKIGSSTDAGLVNNQSFTNVATVQSKRNMAQPSSFNGTYDTASFSISHLNTSFLSTYAANPVNELHAPIEFLSRMGNTSSDREEGGPYGVDVLPYPGENGTGGYHGTYIFTALKAISSAEQGLSGLKIYFTTDASWRTARIIKRQDVVKWTPAAIDPTTGEVTVPQQIDGKPIVAWAYTNDALPSGSYFEFRTTIRPVDSQPGDTFVNRWANDHNKDRALALIAGRSVTGTAWYDRDGDGVRDADDPGLPAVRVTLYRQDGDQVVKSLVDNSDLTTVTDSRGFYRLNGIPSGRYRVKFEPAKGTDWSSLTVTRRQNPMAHTSNDSDSLPITGDRGLKAAYIDLSFPPADELSTSTYIDADEDNGLTGGLPVTAPDPLHATTRLVGRPWADWDSFDLVTEPMGGAPASALPGRVAFTQPAGGSDREMDIPVDTADLDKPGTYEYSVGQDRGSAPGVTYDDGRYLVTLTVKDDFSRLTRVVTTRVTAATRRDADRILFTDIYTADPVSAIIKAHVTLTGRHLEEGEFRFELVDCDSGGKVLATAANDAQGGISFPLAFSQAGTHSYMIRQVVGTEVAITYDKTGHKARIAVVDQPAKGALESKVDTGGSGIEFVNSYKPAGSATDGTDKPCQPGMPGQPENPDKPEGWDAHGHSGGSGTSVVPTNPTSLRPTGMHERQEDRADKTVTRTGGQESQAAGRPDWIHDLAATGTSCAFALIASAISLLTSFTLLLGRRSLVGRKQSGRRPVRPAA